MFVCLCCGLETVGAETGSHFVMLCQQNGADCKNEGLRDRRGRGTKASCNVNRMRKAYYFYFIPYDGAVCSHLPKRRIS